MEHVKDATAAFTEIDVLVCLVILGTTIAAFLRGFAKESLSLACYVGASVATLALYPNAVQAATHIFKESKFLSYGTIVVLFISLLILFSIFSAMVLDNMRDFRLGIFDRSLGLMFGLVKGFLIVGLLHYGVYMMNGKEDPKMLVEGETYSLSKMGRDVVSQTIGTFKSDKGTTTDKLNKILHAAGKVISDSTKTEE